MDQDYTQLLLNSSKNKERLTYITIAKEIVDIQKWNCKNKIYRIIKGYMSLDKNKDPSSAVSKHIRNAVTLTICSCLSY